MELKVKYSFFIIFFIALSYLTGALYASKGACACSSKMITCLVTKQKMLMTISLSSLSLLQKMIHVLKLQQESYDDHVSYIDQLEFSVQSLAKKLAESTEYLEEQKIKLEEYAFYVEKLLLSLNQQVAYLSEGVVLNNQELKRISLCIDSLCSELIENQEWYLKLQKEYCNDA